MNESLLQQVVRRYGAERLAEIMTPDQLEALRFEWRAWARPNQLAPDGDWLIWFVMAGRGFGKTRVGGEWVRERIESGASRYSILAAPTAGDVRDVMIEGESGIMRICPPWFRPQYEPSKSRLTWPNGAVSYLLSADEPDRFRGKQGDTVWCDEICAWRYPEAFDMLRFGMRLGSPRYCVTSTPVPIKLVRELVSDPACVVTRGSTFDNAANLAPEYLTDLRRKYEGTRLGRQELYAEILDDVPGALWQRQRIDELRVRQAHDLVRVVVAVDPAVTTGEDADETGIVVAGKGVDGHAYVLADLTCRLSPDAWARRAVGGYREHKADRLVAEVNNGGDLVERVIRTVDPRVSYRAVRASRGKITRAEPVAALYEQGRVHHVGSFAALEDQQCRYVPDAYDGSPDRVDALVWALTDLMLGEGNAGFASLADVSAARRM